MNLKLEIIEKEHKLDDFDCGNENINNYLKNDALERKNEFLSTTYVLIKKESKKVIGYYTIAPISLNDNETTYVLSRNNKYKAIGLLLAQIGIDKSFQGKGYGKSLIKQAMQTIIKTTAIVRFPVIILEAANEKLIKYYIKQGFETLADKERKLFMSIPKLLKTQENL